MRQVVHEGYNRLVLLLDEFKNLMSSQLSLKVVSCHKMIAAASFFHNLLTNLLGCPTVPIPLAISLALRMRASRGRGGEGCSSPR